MVAIGVLVPHRPGEPEPPDTRPIGRAALRLAADGIDVVFGSTAQDGALIGHRALPDRYEPVQIEVAAAYDRYPSQTDPTGYAALRDALPDVPVHNPMAMTLLCRDKVATQRALEAHGLPQPAIETDPARFAERLETWGSAYLKPRYGAFGRGVRRVLPGDPLPAEGEGAVPGRIEPLFLQRAVPPLEGWTGIACRILVQRTPTGWWVGPAVARRSTTDWVVNAARGADVIALRDFLPELEADVSALAESAAIALSQEPHGDRLVEIGADVVIGRDGQLAIVEINSRPRGRLEALAGLSPEDFLEAHVQACCRPLRTIASRYSA